MSNQVQALCFQFSSDHKNISLAFDSLNIAQVTNQKKASTVIVYHNLQLEKHFYAQFYTEKEVDLGDNIEFVVLEHKSSIPISEYLSGWVNKNRVLGFYMQDSHIYILLDSPKKDDINE